MSDYTQRKDGKEYYDSLPKEQQELIYNVMLCTMDMCSELLQNEINRPIMFLESMAYKVCMWEMLDHMSNNEYYNFDKKTWEKLK